MKHAIDQVKKINRNNKTNKKEYLNEASALDRWNIVNYL